MHTAQKRRVYVTKKVIGKPRTTVGLTKRMATTGQLQGGRTAYTPNTRKRATLFHSVYPKGESHDQSRHNA